MINLIFDYILANFYYFKIYNSYFIIKNLKFSSKNFIL